MRLPSSLVLPALCCAASAAASDVARVFVYPRTSPRAESRAEGQTLSPIAARSVLAQRAGVEQFHSADLYTHDSIRAVNDFGTRSSLFNLDGTDGYRQAYFLIETDEDLSHLFDSRNPRLSTFDISPAPSANSTLDLFTDLLHQAKAASTVSRQGKLAQATHISIQDFTTAFKKAKKGSITDHDLVIITIPPSSTSSKQDHNIWGTYAMPNSHRHTYLHKRDQREKPLESPPTDDDAATLPPNPTRLAALAATQSALKGIFPTCFPSLATCTNLTRNCTGHGACSLKYTDPSAADQAPAKHCYTCQCTPQKREDSEGRVSTTYYGGPACQKKDVSVQFWLIVLFSVGLVGLVSFAVGTVWSMGEEELPSVIGAGVSGPVSRR